MIIGDAGYFLFDKLTISKKALHYCAEKTDRTFPCERFDWPFLKFFIEVRDHSALNCRH
jgi:hypothetical protein